MRSRSFLLHDSHLTCSINYRERVDTRALHRIKSLSIIRLISLALLLAVSVTACSSGKTKPRGMGIGLRSGSINDATYIEGRDGEVYSERDFKVNDDSIPIFPVFLQLDENLLSNWAYGEAVVDFAPMRRENLPPKLKEEYDYGTIINENTTDFDLDSSKTKITEFRSAYPEYATQIDNATNPAISADYDVKLYTVGYNWGIFLPISERHRIFTLGMGVGLSYSDGVLIMNLCDPYHISIAEVPEQDYKQAFCQNKQKLVNVSYKGPILNSNYKMILYTYVGEDFEFNFISQNSIQFSPPSKETDFDARYFPLYLEIINVVYRL